MDDLRVLKAPQRPGGRRNRAQAVKSFCADESGAIALVMALALVAFLGLGALAVDYGYMSDVQGSLKKAAEAGALAGANALAQSLDWNAAATSIVHQNQAAGQLLTDCQVQSGYWSLVQGKFFATAPTETPTPVQAVQVVVAKSAGNNGGPLQLIFGPILGISTSDLSGTAVAVVKSPQGIWSILETGTGTVTISGTAAVNGSVGVSSGGKLTLTGSASVKGTAYLNTGATKSYGYSTSVQGGTQQNADANTIVANAVSSATTAYNNFKSLTKTLGPTSINLSGTAIATYTGTSGVNVMSLSSLQLSNSSILNLSAPAGGSFVILDSGTFSLSGTGQIVLQGGLKPENVTFVNKGTNTVTVGNSCKIAGNILSPNGAINLSGAATYNGTLVGGKAITVANSVTSLQTSWLPAPGGTGGGGGAALVQ